MKNWALRGVLTSWYNNTVSLFFLVAESVKGGKPMYQALRCDAEKIARGAIAAVSPEAAVRRVENGTGGGFLSGTAP